MLVQQRVQPAQGATAGGAADAGIDQHGVVADTVQPLLQQIDPALAGTEAVSGAEAVAQDEEGLGASGLGVGECWRQQQGEQEETE